MNYGVFICKMRLFGSNFYPLQKSKGMPLMHQYKKEVSLSMPRRHTGEG
jgi:hypothetical protein